MDTPSENPIIGEYTIQTMADFIDGLPEKEMYAARTVYRGHSSATWKLVPGLFRLEQIPITALSAARFEEYLLEDFERQATRYANYVPQDKLEWIALAQHYHLPTRLLDWTESPLTALFFAVNDSSNSNNDEQDGAVWSLIAFALKKTSFARLEDIDREINTRPNNIYFPRHISSRISAQQGCFTVHARIEREPFVSLEDKANQDDNSVILSKYIIPADRKAYFRGELNRLGINYFTLFPDLDGLSRKLVWDIQNYSNTDISLSSYNI